MNRNNEKSLRWKTKLDTYYTSTPKQKMIKDLTKAGFKVVKQADKK